MADDNDKPDSGIPAWQRTQKDDAEQPEQPAEDQLEVARRFLEDDDVKTASREKKVAFLKAKNIEDGDIEKLLGQPEPSPAASETIDEASPPTPATSAPTTTSTTPPPSEPTSDRAPIVTYPEFLTKPVSNAPPPLVTTAGILTTLQVTAALSTLLVGTSKYLLSPMLERLNESREELHSTTATRLDAMLTLLEASVSELPAPAKKNGGEEEDSDAEDPTEMFHRDVGTQTVMPVPSVASAPKLPPADAQATRIESLTKSLNEVKEGLRSQSDGLSDIKTLIDVFGDDLDTMTYRQPGELPGYDFTGSKTKTNEQVDETRKVRDSIRRIKGALLSTRSFPASTR